MRLFLIRHGQVIPPKAGSYYGGTEVPLSDVGEAEAHRAAASIAPEPLDFLVSSPLGRARFGAECVLQGRTGLKLDLEPRFAEIDRGAWVGLTPDELEARHPGHWQAHLADLESWRGHGGESLGDLRDRVWDGLMDLRRARAGQTGAIVSHMFPTRAVLAQVLELPLQDWGSLEIPTASVSLVEFEADGDGAQVLFVGRKP